MGRVFIVVGCWFALWIAIGITWSVLSRGADGLLSGAMNGAWIATFTSFAWPWLMPSSIRRWMDGKSSA